MSRFDEEPDGDIHGECAHEIHRLQSRIEQLELELAEAQKGHARYEYVRKLNVRQFQEIFIRNLSGEYHFDDLIDAAIQEGKA